MKPRKLFRGNISSDTNSQEEKAIENLINDNIKKIGTGILLINTQTITATKTQTVIEGFQKNKNYNSIFCFTEIKVGSLNFNPKGIKVFIKHRNSRDKKGGGLMLGYKKDRNIKLEEIETEHKDVLAVEGTVRNRKIRIILVYFDSTKKKSGKDFERNRKIQRIVEKLMDMEPKTAMLCLENINGRLTKLEPHIMTDYNGDMIEK